MQILRAYPCVFMSLFWLPWTTLVLPTTAEPLLSGWLEVSSYALARISGRPSTNAHIVAIAMKSQTPELLAVVVGDQPHLLAILMLGLVYTALVPVSLATFLSCRLDGQRLSRFYGHVWCGYCCALAALVASGMATLLCLDSSRQALNDGAKVAPDFWREAFGLLLQFVNTTGHGLAAVPSWRRGPIIAADLAQANSSADAVITETLGRGKQIPTFKTSALICYRQLTRNKQRIRSM